MTPQIVAKTFGCTVEQARAQYLKGADGLDGMAARAERTGKKVNGYTAEKLRALAADQRMRAGL